jgi:sigma-B regulation protein RsbU (phosphoserine phosphatase)
VLADLVDRDRLAQPDELAGVVDAALAPLGLRVRMYLADQEQRLLRPVPRPGEPPAEPLPIESTVAGRAFATVRAIGPPAADTGPGGPAGRLWMPLLDGTERLGVLEFQLPDGEPGGADPDLLAGCDLYGQLVGHLVATKIPYGDALLQVRRTRRMSEASELVWRLLPPLTFVCRRAVVSAVLEPCYEVGGDGFDYAVDGSILNFAIYDTAGHELRAGLGTATVMSAVRAARRTGAGLREMAHAADRALAEHLPELRFTTAVLGRLDLDTGRLHYVNAGHPRPLIVRRGRVVRDLVAGRRMPLGLDDPQGEDVGEEVLERGDRLLLYTDGVTEARDPSGELFGTDRLIDLVEREAGVFPAPEALRRLCHAVLQHYDGPPTDDATTMLIEWSAEAARGMLPLGAGPPPP